MVKLDVPAIVKTPVSVIAPPEITLKFPLDVTFPPKLTPPVPPSKVKLRGVRFEEILIASAAFTVRPWKKESAVSKVTEDPEAVAFKVSAPN